MKFFIASSWVNLKQIQLLRDNLISLGHEVINTDTQSKRADSLFAPGDDWRQRAELRKVFEQNMTSIEESDILILLLPAGKTSHISAGVGYGFGKRLVLIGTLDRAESHYFIFDEDHKTIEDYIASLKIKK